jgi:hypothetical protein
MKSKSYKWYVNTAMYHKQLGLYAEDMEEARRKAFLKFQKMSYEEFCKYIDLNVGGFRSVYGKRY